MKLLRRNRPPKGEPVVARLCIPAQNGLPTSWCNYTNVDDARHDLGKLNGWLGGVSIEVLQEGPPPA